MEYYVKSVIPIIESNYDKFTTTEKTIADFFIHNQKKMDFSVNHIAELLYTSKATLTRFAQKCGYHGYKEFIYQYEETFVEKQEKITGNTRMEIRFMRIGVNVDSMTDSDMMRMSSVFQDKRCLVFGFSISGETEEVTYLLEESYKRGAKTVLFTTNNREGFENYCTEVVLLPSLKHLNHGNVISPQFPILVMLDIIYAYYMEQNKYLREEMHDSTLRALEERENREKKLYQM